MDEVLFLCFNDPSSRTAQAVAGGRPRSAKNTYFSPFSFQAVLPKLSTLLLAVPPPFCVRCGRGFNVGRRTVASRPVPRCGKWVRPPGLHFRCIPASRVAERAIGPAVFAGFLLFRTRREVCIHVIGSAAVVPRTHVSGTDRSPSCLPRASNLPCKSRGTGCAETSYPPRSAIPHVPFMTRCASLFQRSALSPQQQRASFLVMFLRFLRGVVMDSTYSTPLHAPGSGKPLEGSSEGGPVWKPMRSPASVPKFAMASQGQGKIPRFFYDKTNCPATG